MKDHYWQERWRVIATLMALLIQMQQECGFIEDLLDEQKPK